MRKLKTLYLDPSAPCPCESGKRLRYCCLLPNGSLRKETPRLQPPAPRTGRGQVGCYLARTMDCSLDLSAEHYLSRSVLEAIGSPAIAINGVPWLAPGEQKVVGIENLTAKILCIRHNSALSPLDQVAGQFFKRLRVIHADLQRRSLSFKRSLVIISGEALELWMLKLACGLFYSKNAAIGGTRLIDDHEIDERLVEEAFLRDRWQRGCGLYMKAPQGHRIPLMDAVSMAPLTAAGTHRVVGASIVMTGLEFELLFDPIGVNPETFSAERWAHRPSELRFEIERRAHSIALTWAPGTPPRLINMINRPALIPV